jgi:hypothetical protein
MMRALAVLLVVVMTVSVATAAFAGGHQLGRDLAAIGALVVVGTIAEAIAHNTGYGGEVYYQTLPVYYYQPAPVYYSAPPVYYHRVHRHNYDNPRYWEREYVREAPVIRRGGPPAALYREQVRSRSTADPWRQQRLIRRQ